MGPLDILFGQLGYGILVITVLVGWLCVVLLGIAVFSVFRSWFRERRTP